MSDQYPGQPEPEQQPYGQQYGQGGYPQQPYGQQYGQPPYGHLGGAPRSDYAGWLQRVAATLIDAIIIGIPTNALYYGGLFLAVGDTRFNQTTQTHETTGGNPLGYLLIFLTIVLGIAFFIWNVGLKQGRTGATIGKGVLDIAVVKEADREPLGVGLSIGRYFVHILDALPCYRGYLWPLWDDKKQTFADKILNTIVVRRP